MKLITLRYMWKIEGSDKINFKMVCGPESEHEDFVNAVLALDGVCKFTSEYVNEIDLDKIDRVTIHLNKEENK